MESRQLMPQPIAARLVAPDVQAPRGVLLGTLFSISFLFVFALSPVTAETMSIEPKYVSLINEPMIEDARLEQTEDEWRLQLDLKFANEFLADTGIIPEFFDLPLNQSDKSPTLRVVFVRQRPNPKGNPDIFRPVTRRFVVVTSRASTITTFVLLNAGSKFSRNGPTQRLGMIPVASAAAAQGQPKQSVRGVDVTEKRSLPVLYDVKLRDVRPKGRGYFYTFEFDVMPSNQKSFDRGIVVQVMEAPPTDPQVGGDTMNDWILVYAPLENDSALGADDAPQAAAPRKRIQYSREFIADYRRNLVVINRLGDERETKQQPFAVLKVR